MRHSLDTTTTPLSDADNQRLAAIREFTASDSIENFKDALNAAITEYVTSDAFKKMGRENQKEELFDLNCIRTLLDGIGVVGGG